MSSTGHQICFCDDCDDPTIVIVYRIVCFLTPLGHCLSIINEKRETRNEKRQTTNEKRETTNDKRQTTNSLYLFCEILYSRIEITEHGIEVTEQIHRQESFHRIKTWPSFDGYRNNSNAWRWVCNLWIEA